MKNKRMLRMGATLSATALFALPFASFADELPALAVAKFNVVLTANSFKNAVTVGPGTAVQSAPVTLGWSATGAKNCIGNWSAEPLSNITGTVTGTIPLKDGTPPVAVASRTFTIVCFGIGTAKSAKVTVTLAKPDLSISKFSISGFTAVTIPAGSSLRFKKNTFRAGPRAYSLVATLKNSGKLKADTVVVTYQQTETPTNPGSWGALTDGVQTVTSIGPGAVQTPAGIFFPANPAPDKGFHFRVCADLANAIVEANESNNCSKSIGPFQFAEQP